MEPVACKERSTAYVKLRPYYTDAAGSSAERRSSEPMRDLLVVAVFGVGLIYALKDPFVGLLVFTWISVMNPHRYSWGFAYDLPLAQAAAAVTLLSMVMHMEKVRWPRTRESVLFILFWGWTTLTTFFAMYPDRAWWRWNIITKIFFMILVTMLLLRTRKQLFAFVVTLIVCVGFIGVKGAFFGIVTRGEQRVWGPPDSFLDDNNGCALAMVMVMPFCFFLRELVPQRWQSRALLVIGLGLVLSTILTYSRGGLLGLVAAGLATLVYSRHKLRVAALAAVLVVGAFAVLPAQWFERMNTVKTYEEDGSARMRLNSWAMAFNLAKDQPLGGGLECWEMENYYKYSPTPEHGRTEAGVGSTAHSIYFEVMGTQGFVGLAIYLGCLVGVLLALRRIKRTAPKETPSGLERVVLARAFTASIAGYMVSGAFLSMAYFDLFWWIFAVAVCFTYMASTGEWERVELPQATAPQPALVAPAMTTRDAAR